MSHGETSLLPTNSNGYSLVIRQQPEQALATPDGKVNNRKPVDPPPILEMKVNHEADPTFQWLVSPYYFVMAILIDENLQGNKKLESDQLLGQTTSSLHKLKDVNNCDGGFFVFGDLSVRKVGRYRLRFHLFDANRPLGMAQLLAWVDSQPFNVLARKDFEGLRESTHLSRAFADQGVKLKISKGSRSQKRKDMEPQQQAAHGSCMKRQRSSGNTQWSYEFAVPGYGSTAHSPTHEQPPQEHQQQIYIPPLGTPWSNNVRVYQNFSV